MSADPLTIHGLGSDLNAYAYVSGRALKGIDRVGLCDEQNSTCPAVASTPEGGDVHGGGRSGTVVRSTEGPPSYAVPEPPATGNGTGSGGAPGLQDGGYGGAVPNATNDPYIDKGGWRPSREEKNQLMLAQPWVQPLRMNTPEGSPDHKGNAYRKSAALETGSIVFEVGGAAATMAPEALAVKGVASGVGGVTTFYRGMTYGEAIEVVEMQGLNLQRIAANQALNPGAAGPGAYLTSQEGTATLFANYAGHGGRGLGPGVVRMHAPSAEFEAFAARYGIRIETPIPRIPNATETLIPLEHLEEFNSMCTFCMH